MYWNRLLKLDNDRLTKKCLVYDLRVFKDNWCTDLQNILLILNLDINLQDYMPLNLNEVSVRINAHNNRWVDEMINLSSKLRTYRIIKNWGHYENEQYLNLFIPRYQRIKLSQLRLGVLPIKVETGRYSKVAVEDRICEMCESGEVEDESQVKIPVKRFS